MHEVFFVLHDMLSITEKRGGCITLFSETSCLEWDFVRKRGLLFLGLAILSNAAANVLIKMGMASRGEAVLEGLLPALFAIAFNPVVVAGFFFFALTFVLYSVALSSLDLSYAYPLMTGGALLLIFALSAVLLGEYLSVLRLGGMLLIMGGITVVSLKG